MRTLSETTYELQWIVYLF